MTIERLYDLILQIIIRNFNAWLLMPWVISILCVMLMYIIAHIILKFIHI